MIVAIFVVVAIAKKSDDESKPAWTKKKLTDYSDADMERLLDQWNVSKTHSFQCRIDFIGYLKILAGRRRRGSR